MAEALAKDMPEVEYSVIATPLRKIMLTLDNQKSIRAEGKYAGEDFFKLFSYDLIAGDATTALIDKHAIVLSDLLAIKLFGTTENLIGRSVGVTQVQNQEPFKITGIFRAPGPRASEQFDFIIPIQVMIDADPGMKEWGNTFANTFVLLKPGVKPADFNRKIADFIKRETNNEITYRTPFITRYSENYLYGRYENGIRVGGRIDYVKLFSLIAVFILAIACINFMNLSTAKAAERAKEVGIKKVLGAERQMLIRQYLCESMLMAFAAMLLAGALVLLILPFFNQVTGKSIVLNHPRAGLLLAVLGITLFTGLIAGSYPALYLSRFKPASVLKGKLKNSISELFVRQGLVVFQFTLSIILITGVIVVYRQMSFIQNKNLGYNRDHVISFLKEGKLNDQKQQDAFLAELRNVPGVLRASTIGHSLTGHNSGTYGVEWEGKDLNDKTEFEAVAVDYDMLETLGFSIKEGRAFSKSFGADTTKIIFNEAAIRFMGLKNPVGKTVKFWDNKMQIIGVVRDFHFQSLHEKVKPLLFYLNPENSYFFMARIQTGKEKTAIAGLEALYQQFNPGFSLQYSFLDENYQQLYTGERRVSVLSRCFAGLAILISCLGLFGLTAFTAERRSKEIGIRKVLGASAASVVVLLSTNFLKLALLAIVIAFPIAWWATSSWLRGFEYRVDLGAGVFLFAGISVILITLITVSLRSVRAALANPVKSLKAQ
jgi:predicted permease